MLAMNYRGPYRVRADKNKPHPEIEHPEDAIVRVLRSCICGSDLHLYHGLVPDTRVGSTFGHEFVGEIVEVGSEVQNVKVGDIVMVPFNIACGRCAFCRQQLYGNCMRRILKPLLWEVFSATPIQPVDIMAVRLNTFVFPMPMWDLRLFPNG